MIPRRPVVHLIRTLDEPGGLHDVQDDPTSAGRWSVRGSRPQDLDGWLEIQNEVLAERGAPRRWDRRMWERELVGRPWWRPERLLIAHVPGESALLGCVAVEISVPARPEASDAWAQLHWLAVRPAAQRQGIATRLVHEAARIARTAGCRELRAETSVAWHDAIRFYQSLRFSEV